MAGRYRRSKSIPDCEGSKSIPDCEGGGLERRNSRRGSSVIGSMLWGVLSSYSRISKVLTPLTSDDLPDGAVSPSSEREEQKQAEAWTQAIYNSMVLVLVFVTGCIIMAVYYILEPFFYPLLWAVLIGLVLHPVKQASTLEIKKWLNYLETFDTINRIEKACKGNKITESGSTGELAADPEGGNTNADTGMPLSVGITLCPIFFLNWLTVQFEYIVYSNRNLLLYSCLGIVSLLPMYYLNKHVHFFRLVHFIPSFLHSVDLMINYASFLQFCTVPVGFVVLLILSKQSEYHTALRILSTFLWLLTLVNVWAYLIGGIVVPLVVFPLLFVIIEFKDCPRLQTYFAAKASDGQNVVTDDKGYPLEDSECDNLTVTDSADSEVITSVTEKGTEGKSDSIETGHKHRVSFKPVPMLVSEEDEAVDDTDSKKARGQSNQVFLILMFACLIVLLWKYPLFLLLLLPLCVLCGLKYLFSLAVVKDSFICKLPEVTIAVMSWVRQRKQVLFPSPMPMLVRMYLFVDRKVLNFVKHSTSSLLSAFIIISLIFVSVSGVILLFIEIQVELTHYVGVAVQIWNRTIVENPKLTEWIGDGNESLHSTFGLFADQSYVYGREWLATKLHSLASGSGANTSIVEKEILNLFDQLYQSYVLKTMSSTSLITDYPDNAMVDHEHNDELWYELQKLASDNLETIITVLQSLWFIFSKNLALAVSFLCFLLKLLFTGGTALLNVVVFITALFYLLSYSEEDYLPVKWVTDLFAQLTQQQQPPTTNGGRGGGGGGDLGRAFSRAIRSVFHASLRRALFYGLYTWLIHTVFGLPVSILPSVLAAVAGAMPFVCSYWLALPAVLELWLMSGSPLAALALLGLSLMPYFFVETLINSEIEGGHPYLTGLAIAGGIYFAGLEGALFGPILLCCLLFFVTLV